VGESLGSLCGGTLFLLLSRRGLGRFYWLTLGAAAIVGTLTVLNSVIFTRRANVSVSSRVIDT
jgi:hypothetical protein